MSIKAIIGLETVDSILSAFETQKTALETLAGRLGDKARAKQTTADTLLADAAAANAERERALRVADRIANLVG